MPGQTVARDSEERGFGLRPLAPAIGVEISGLDLSLPLEPEVFARIEAAFVRHSVLLARGQSLSEDAQVAFALRFGPLAQNVNRHGGESLRHPATMLISNVLENGRLIGALPDGEMLFHSDQCYVETPCMAAMTPSRTTTPCPDHLASICGT